jgi:hypothetical protein
MIHFPPEVLGKITELIRDKKTLYNFLSICEYFSNIIPRVNFFHFHRLCPKTKQLSVFESNKNVIEKLTVNLTNFKEISKYLTGLENIKTIEFVNRRLVIGDKEEELYIDLRKITNKKCIEEVSFVNNISLNFPHIQNKNIKLDIRGKNIKVLFINNSFDFRLLIDDDTIVETLTIFGSSKIDILSSHDKKRRLKVRSFKHYEPNLPRRPRCMGKKHFGKGEISYYLLKDRLKNTYQDDYILVDKTSFLTLHSEVSKINTMQFIEPEFLEKIYFEGALVDSNTLINLREYRNIKTVKMELCCVMDITETERKLYCDNDYVDRERDFFLMLFLSENEIYTFEL